MPTEALRPLGDDGDGLLQDLAATVSKGLVDFSGMPLDTAEAMAQTIAEEIADRWGGLNLYFPKGWRSQAKRLHLQIYQEFTGTNHTELARKYQVSTQWVYRVVKRLCDEDKARRQGTLSMD